MTIDPQIENSLNLDELLNTMQQAITNKIKDLNPEDIIMIGIHTGGYWIAEQLYQRLELSNPLGSLNISFYRDDFTKIGLHPEVKPSQLPAALDDKHIILIDDVLYTGRTVRAALNEIFDYGRPGTSDQEITITETGGKTPVENTIISFKSLGKEVRGVREEYGQTTWFTFPEKVDYISPGGSEMIHIKLLKPEDAPVGNYLWEGEVQTKYAGNKPFQISFAIIPPGVRELLSDVRKFESDPFITGHPQMKTVRETT